MHFDNKNTIHVTQCNCYWETWNGTISNRRLLTGSEFAANLKKICNSQIYSLNLHFKNTRRHKSI